jgi:putative methanogenesis marker protein 8
VTGIVKTSPIKEDIEHIDSNGGVILNERTARINQVEGVRRAFELGFKHVAVSVAGFQTKTISEIRELETTVEPDVLIFSVCNACVHKADVKHITKADIACASASRILRTKIGSKAMIQLGMTIPVYALTKKGKKVVLSYLAEFDHKLVIFRTSKLPYPAEGKGPILKSETRTKSLKC